VAWDAGPSDKPAAWLSRAREGGPSRAFGCASTALLVAVPIHATDDDVGAGMIPCRDRGPLELATEVPLDAGHQVLMANQIRAKMTTQAALVTQ
jgi:hypothetical protein